MLSLVREISELLVVFLSQDSDTDRTSGLGHKKISETWNIPRSTIKSNIKFEIIWLDYKPAKPPNLTDQTWRALIREEIKSPKIACRVLSYYPGLCPNNLSIYF